MAVVIEVECEGHTHRLEVRDDGTYHMLDHEEIDVRAFVAFGAKPPGCLEEIEKARAVPIFFLFKHMDINQKTKILLACDFTEHVLPIWYEYYPDNHRPRKAIEAAREYVAGKIKKSTLEMARKATAASAASAAASAASAAWAAEEAAASSAWAAWAAEHVAAAAEEASTAAMDAWSARSALRSSGWAADRSAWATYYHAKAHGNDPEAAEDAEIRWQIGRVLRFLSSS